MRAGDTGDVMAPNADAVPDLISASLINEALLKSLPPSRYNSAGNQQHALVTDPDDVVPTPDVTLLKSLPPSRLSYAWHQPDEAIDSVDHIAMSHGEAGASDIIEKNHDGDARIEQHSSSDKQVSAEY
jgi:hypothetical protein